MTAAPAKLGYPISWIRCAECRKIVPYGSGELVPVHRGRDVVYMHPECRHKAELREWNQEPPLHGGD